MSAADMAPLCTRCLARHWPDSRHLGRIRRTVRRLLKRR